MSEEKTYPVLDLSGERRVVGQGMTTDAPTGLPAFRDPVKELMCVVMCACKKLFEDNRDAPELQTDGEAPGVDASAAAPETPETSTTKPRRMQQNCVASLFQTIDKAANYRSWVKAEVYYDMQGYRARFRNIADKIPGRPQPLMSREPVTKPLQWQWGVISHVGRRKNVQLSAPTFTGQGNSLRRPDIVVVRNPAMPPEENNISVIYEMKFDERVNRPQVQAYERIVLNDRNRVQTIEVKDCRCEQRKEKIRQMTHAELMAWAAAVSAAMAAAANDKNNRGGGMEPATVSTGLAIVGAIALGVLVVATLPETAVAAAGAFLLRMLVVGGATTAVAAP